MIKNTCYISWFLLFNTFFSVGCSRVGAHVASSDGYQAYISGRFEEAVSAYKKAKTNLPKDDSIKRNLAFSYLAAARESSSEIKAQPYYNGAVELLLELANNNPSDKEVIGVMFDALVDANRLNELVHYFKKRAIIEPDNKETMRLLALAEIRRGNYASALSAFNKRLLLEPNNANVFASKATLCWEWLRMDSPKDSEVAINIANDGFAAAVKADELDPMHPSALVYAGLLLRERASRRAEKSDAEKDIQEAEQFLVKMRERRQVTDSHAG